MQDIAGRAARTETPPKVDEHLSNDAAIKLMLRIPSARGPAVHQCCHALSVSLQYYSYPNRGNANMYCTVLGILAYSTRRVIIETPPTAYA